MTHELEGAVAVLETSAGEIRLGLHPDKAPGHAENFAKLIEAGFYDGTVFHRIIPGFMIQGGCPDGTGMGGPGWNIDAEFNDTHHARGVLSMARSADPNSAGSQFFICHGDAGFLDGEYTAFGHLVEGDAVLDAIASAAVVSGGEGSKPVEPVTIDRASVVRADS